MNEVSRRMGLSAKEPPDQDGRGKIDPDDGEVKRIGMKGSQEARSYVVFKGRVDG